MKTITHQLLEKLLKTDVRPNFLPDLPGEAFQNLADISNAKELGWRPLVDLDKGIKLSIDYIKKNVLPIIQPS